MQAGVAVTIHNTRPSLLRKQRKPKPKQLQMKLKLHAVEEEKRNGSPKEGDNEPLQQRKNRRERQRVTE